jgi:hypothetical protein
MHRERFKNSSKPTPLRGAVELRVFGDTENFPIAMTRMARHSASHM